MNAPLPPPTKPTLRGLFDIDSCAFLLFVRLSAIAISSNWNRFGDTVQEALCFEPRLGESRVRSRSLCAVQRRNQRRVSCALTKPLRRCARHSSRRQCPCHRYWTDKKGKGHVFQRADFHAWFLSFTACTSTRCAAVPGRRAGLAVRPLGQNHPLQPPASQTPCHCQLTGAGCPTFTEFNKPNSYHSLAEVP